MHAIDSRRSALVELTRDVLYCQVGFVAEVQFLHHHIRHPLAKDAIFALLQQFPAESEQVIDA